MTKTYSQEVGSCKDCTLAFYCKQNKEGIQKFLKSLGIVCVYGKTIKIRGKE